VPLFDAYLVVDWSAAAVPRQGKDSIWIGFGRRKGRALRLAPSANPATRADATRYVRWRLQELAAEEARVFVGFDFPYGHPTGLARALGQDPSQRLPAWRFVWQQLQALIRDGEDNANDRFTAASRLNARLGPSPGPFWGGPRRWESETFRATSPGFPYTTSAGVSLGQYRLAELAMRARGQQVQETWKLYGNGSVGSQSLMGIPRVAALRWAPTLRAHSRIWPFETGFAAQPGANERPFILHAEIWPRVAPFKACATKVKDEIQVECLVQWIAAEDAAGRLGVWLDAPPDLSPIERDTCVREEGWILGA
jgi:precorrin-8X/cobalt-precorrin-8 methylmutase